jgi:hypothetical protein
MGSWGPGVFSDDLACEIRDQYRALLGEGRDGVTATDLLLGTFGQALADQDSAPVFWLSLAVVQWRMGRLEERVQLSALRAIDDGSALRSWQHDSKLLRARRKELDKVAALLNSPPPKAKQVRKRFKNSCDWARGELIAFRLRSGRYVIFRVLGHWIDAGGTSPVVEVLDWCGEIIPQVADLETLAIRRTKEDVPVSLKRWMTSERRQFMIGEVNKRRIPHDRISRLDLKLPPTQEVGGFSVWLWRTIDEQLEREFGYR